MTKYIHLNKENSNQYINSCFKVKVRISSVEEMQYFNCYCTKNIFKYISNTLYTRHKDINEFKCIACNASFNFYSSRPVLLVKTIDI